MIKVKKLKRIFNPNGDVIKYLDSKIIKKFGEVYFSEIKYRKFKGWNKHLRLKCYLSVPKGKVKFFFYLKKLKKLKTIIVTSKSPKLLVISNNIWFKFTSLDKPFSIVVNFIKRKHKKNEVNKIDCSKYKFPE
jgi:hypothetical protein